MENGNAAVGVTASSTEYIELGTVALVSSFVVLGAIWKIWVSPTNSSSYPGKLSFLDLLQLFLACISATCAVIQRTREVGRKNIDLSRIIGEMMSGAIGLYSITIPLSIRLRKEAMTPEENPGTLRFKVLYPSIAALCTGVNCSAIWFQTMPNVVALVRVSSWLVVFFFPIIRTSKWYLHLLRELLCRPSPVQNNDYDQYEYARKMFISYNALWVPGSCFMLSHWIKDYWWDRFIATHALLLYCIASMWYSVKTCKSVQELPHSHDKSYINEEPAKLIETLESGSVKCYSVHSTPEKNAREDLKVVTPTEIQPMEELPSVSTCPPSLSGDIWGISTAVKCGCASDIVIYSPMEQRSFFQKHTTDDVILSSDVDAASETDLTGNQGKNDGNMDTSMKSLWKRRNTVGLILEDLQTDEELSSSLPQCSIRNMLRRRDSQSRYAVDPKDPYPLLKQSSIDSLRNQYNKHTKCPDRRGSKASHVMGEKDIIMSSGKFHPDFDPYLDRKLSRDNSKRQFSTSSFETPLSIVSFTDLSEVTDQEFLP